MLWMAVKTLLTAALIVAISEVVKRGDRLGGLLAALPWVTVLALCWMQVEGQPVDKLSQHARYTFWYVLPTLPMFLFLPWALPRWGFLPAMGGAVAITALCFILTAWLARPLGVELWP